MELKQYIAQCKQKASEMRAAYNRQFLYSKTRFSDRARRKQLHQQLAILVPMIRSLVCLEQNMGLKRVSAANQAAIAYAGRLAALEKLVLSYVAHQSTEANWFPDIAELRLPRLGLTNKPGQWCVMNDSTPIELGGELAEKLAKNRQSHAEQKKRFFASLTQDQKAVLGALLDTCSGDCFALHRADLTARS